MRSSTSSDLPGRCPRCWIKLEQCICALVPRVEPRSEVLVVRHEREAQKSTGTARVAALAIPRLRFVDFNDDPTEADRALSPLVAGEGVHLVFPAVPQSPWPQGPVRRLIFLDGTWRQTRKMMKKLPALEGLPRLWLPPKPEPVLRLRETSFEGGRSTLEAVADALRVLEGPAVAGPLDALHAQYVERVFKARGVWAQKSEPRIQDRSA